MKRILHFLFNWHYDGSIWAGVRMDKVYWNTHRDTTACVCMFCNQMIERPQ